MMLLLDVISEMNSAKFHCPSLKHSAMVAFQFIYCGRQQNINHVKQQHILYTGMKLYCHNILISSALEWFLWYNPYGQISCLVALAFSATCRFLCLQFYRVEYLRRYVLTILHVNSKRSSLWVSLEGLYSRQTLFMGELARKNKTGHHHFLVQIEIL